MKSSVFREYPCEFVTMFVLCQVLAADGNSRISDLAVELLHLLKRQFLDDLALTIDSSSCMSNFSSRQIEICRLLANHYPKITMSVFSGDPSFAAVKF